MPYILSRRYKLSQHWPLTSAACHSALFWWDLSNRSSATDDIQQHDDSTVTSFFVGFDRNYRWRGFLNKKKKLDAFSFLNPFRTEKLTSVRSRVTWVKLAHIWRRFDERRGWAACASLASRNIINQWCAMKASWENELPSYSTHQQPRFVSHRWEHKTSCVWHHVFGARTAPKPACALVFSPSDPERSRLEVYVYPLRGLFFENMIRWNTFYVSQKDFLRF